MKYENLGKNNHREAIYHFHYSTIYPFASTNNHFGIVGQYKLFPYKERTVFIRKSNAIAYGRAVKMRLARILFRYCLCYRNALQLTRCYVFDSI